MAASAATGTHAHAANTQREARSPSRTAAVIFPDRRSVGMSRMLLAISSATDSRPSADALAHSHHGAWRTCVQEVPTHAINPKKTKTMSP